MTSVLYDVDNNRMCTILNYLIQEMNQWMEGMKEASCIYITLFLLELSGSRLSHYAKYIP
jgi:hypothetical protein